jgi:hypothetical protein
VLGVVIAAIAAYVVNALSVATHQALFRGISVGRVLRMMHGAAPYEFLFSYIGLGLFGAVIAHFFVKEGFWSVVVPSVRSCSRGRCTSAAAVWPTDSRSRTRSSRNRPSGSRSCWRRSTTVDEPER